jgi:hypothetical protein
VDDRIHSPDTIDLVCDPAGLHSAAEFADNDAA